MAGAHIAATVISVQGASLVARLALDRVADVAALGVGDLVVIPCGRLVSVAVVDALRHGRRGDDETIAELQLLGELVERQGAARFERGVSYHPLLDAPVLRADQAQTRLVYAQPSASSARIGTLRRSAAVPAYVMIDALLGNHWAVLGTTGSGKSSAVTVLLNAIVDACPYAHVILLDPHGEYARAFEGRAELLDPGNLELPYWLMNAEESCAILAPSRHERAYTEAAILRDAMLAARLGWAAGNRSTTGVVTVDSPTPYRMADLCSLIKDGMGALNKPEGAAPYRALLARIEALRSDRRYAFMFNTLVVRDNMDAVLARLFRFPVSDRPMTIIDLSGMPSEIVDVVVSLLCRLIFEFGLWSCRETPTPLLLVCEEAHRYVPATQTTGFEPSRRAIDRIAKEGRKYGVSLGLVSQRPSEISASALSQCGTVFAFRMTNETDQSFVRNALPDGAAWLFRNLAALGTGEAIVVGEGVTVPMQVRFDPLAADRQPASRSPSFSARWAVEDAGAETVRDTVQRWREQRR